MYNIDNEKLDLVRVAR